MNVIEAIFLGIVQGLAEFLPISSSGHLVLFQKIFGITEPALTYDIFLHIATLIPVLVIYRHDLLALIKNPFQKLTLLLIVGTLPLVVMAIFFKDYIDQIFESGSFLGICFIITGCMLLLADRKSEGTKKISGMTYVDAAVIGTVQAFAVTPAISRSGSTICASLFMDLRRETAAKFSFLLSIPAILGSFVLELKDVVESNESFFALGFLPMMAGFVAALLSGFFAIQVMLKIIKSSKLSYFAYYVIPLGLLVILDQLVLHFVFK